MLLIGPNSKVIELSVFPFFSCLSLYLFFHSRSFTIQQRDYYYKMARYNSTVLCIVGCTAILLILGLGLGLGLAISGEHHHHKWFTKAIIEKIDGVSACTNKIEVCSFNESCNAVDSVCTNGHHCQHCGSDPSEGFCKVSNKVNGVACDDACLIPDTGSCVAGTCDGQCAGQCSVYEDCDVTDVILTPDVIPWVGYAPRLEYLSPVSFENGCHMGTCEWYLGDIRNLPGFHEVAVYERTDEYWSQLCMDQIDSSIATKKCLTADVLRIRNPSLIPESVAIIPPLSNVEATPTPIYDLDRFYTKVYCTYRYSCAKMVPPVPVEISKRQVSGTYATPGGGASGGQFGGSNNSAPKWP